MKNFLLHELTARLIYFGAALAAAHAVAFLAAAHSQMILSNIFRDPSLLPGAQKYLEAAVSSGLLVAGEFLFHVVNKQALEPARG